MDPNETSGNETSPGMRLVCNEPVTSVPSLCSVAGQDQQCYNNHYTTCNGPCSYGAFHTSYCEDTVMQEDFSLSPFSFTFSDEVWDSIFTSPTVGTVDNGSFPVSPFTCPIVSSTPEQGEDAEAQSSSMANTSIYKVASLHPTHPEGHSSMESASHGKSVVALIGNNGTCTDTSVNEVLPAETSISGSVVDCKTCPGCLRPASACHGHRFPSSEVDLKGVKKKKNWNKWTCEIRISKKIVQDSKLKEKSKLWLGTFDTAEQARRALHVGQYLLSAKNKKAQTDTIFDPNTERVLSKFKTCLYAQPLNDELLQKVKKLAKDYGKNCSL